MYLSGFIYTPDTVDINIKTAFQFSEQPVNVNPSYNEQKKKKTHYRVYTENAATKSPHCAFAPSQTGTQFGCLCHIFSKLSVLIPNIWKLCMRQPIHSARHVAGAATFPDIIQYTNNLTLY